MARDHSYHSSDSATTFRGRGKTDHSIYHESDNSTYFKKRATGGAVGAAMPSGGGRDNTNIPQGARKGGRIRQKKDAGGTVLGANPNTYTPTNLMRQAGSSSISSNSQSPSPLMYTTMPQMPMQPNQQARRGGNIRGKKR